MTQECTLTFADLFCGIGGFRLGFERAGASCVFSCEKDSVARRIYTEGFTGGFFENIDHPFPRDVRYVEQLPDVDILCAGFPCQDVSIANNQRKGLEGDRSGLFYEIIRLLQSAHKRPQWLVLENVDGLLTSNNGRDFARIKVCLEECGYGISWRVLDSQYFGVPQRRRRIYIIGYLGGICPGEILFESESGGGDITSLRKEKEEVAYTLTASTGGGSGKEQQQTLLATVLPMKGGNDPNKMGMMVAETLTKTMTRCSDWPNSTLVAGTVSCKWAKGTGGPSGDECQNLVANTLLATQCRKGDNGQDAHSGLLLPQYAGVRRLTPLECERLQGFPEGWTVGHSDYQRYKCLGNAVTVDVVEWIAKRIVSYCNTRIKDHG